MTNDEVIDAFYSKFLNPDDAAFGLDREGLDGYFWQTTPVSTEDAVYEVAEDLDEQRHAEIVAEIEGAYHHWVRRSDLDHIAD